MSRFKEKVLEIVREVPRGYVVSYGQVALMAGIPRAAIQVGWVLNKSGDDGVTPWWRVINKEGFLTIKHEIYSQNFQKKLLTKDGVNVSKNLKVDMKKYRWLPSEKSIKKLKLDDEGVYKILERYGV